MFVVPVKSNWFVNIISPKNNIYLISIKYTEFRQTVVLGELSILMNPPFHEKSIIQNDIRLNGH